MIQAQIRAHRATKLVCFMRRFLKQQPIDAALLQRRRAAAEVRAGAEVLVQREAGREVEVQVWAELARIHEAKYSKIKTETEGSESDSDYDDRTTSHYGSDSDYNDLPPLDNAADTSASWAP